MTWRGSGLKIETKIKQANSKKCLEREAEENSLVYSWQSVAWLEDRNSHKPWFILDPEICPVAYISNNFIFFSLKV